jgi:hypothetical protein
MFERVRSLLAECENAFDASLNGSGAKQPAAEAPKPVQQGENKSLRMLSEVPQFVGVDGRPYGPFKTGESVIVPNKVGELLLRRKVASE